MQKKYIENIHYFFFHAKKLNYDLNIDIKEFNTEKVDKSICTIYETNNLFNIPELEIQIEEMKKFI